MNIKCDLCGTILSPKDTYMGDYYNPTEYFYQCPVCGLKIDYNEACGWEYEYDEVEPEYQDRIKEED